MFDEDHGESNAPAAPTIRLSIHIGRRLSTLLESFGSLTALWYEWFASAAAPDVTFYEAVFHRPKPVCWL